MSQISKKWNPLFWNKNFNFLSEPGFSIFIIFWWSKGSFGKKEPEDDGQTIEQELSLGTKINGTTQNFYWVQNPIFLLEIGPTPFLGLDLIDPWSSMKPFLGPFLNLSDSSEPMCDVNNSQQGGAGLADYWTHQKYCWQDWDKKAGLILSSLPYIQMNSWYYTSRFDIHQCL